MFKCGLQWHPLGMKGKPVFLGQYLPKQCSSSQYTVRALEEYKGLRNSAGIRLEHKSCLYLPYVIPGK